MGWLIGIVILILLVVSAGFRKFALVIVGLGAAAGFVIYANEERKEKLALSRIRPAELKFEGVTLKPDYSGYTLSGRLINGSAQYTLKQVTLKVTMRDCSGESERNCLIIGESNEYVHLGVPPGQARDFNELVYFSGGALKPRGRLVWDYSVVEVKGE